MATPQTELGKLISTKRDLEFKLITVNSKITKFTPETLGEHMDFNRHREVRTHELVVLEAERDALVDQIAILDNQIETLQHQSQGAKAISKQPPKKKLVYDEITKLQKKYPKKTYAELFSMVADKRQMEDSAVKKAYYDYANDLKQERERRAKQKKDEEGQSHDPKQDSRKSPTK